MKNESKMKYEKAVAEVVEFDNGEKNTVRTDCWQGSWNRSDNGCFDNWW